jgi:hypothetical protein
LPSFVERGMRSLQTQVNPVLTPLQACQ